MGIYIVLGEIYIVRCLTIETYDVVYGKVYILVVFSIVFEVVFILCGKIWLDREDEGLYRHGRNTDIQVA